MTTTITTVLRLADGAIVSITLREVSRRTATAIDIDGLPALAWIEAHAARPCMVSLPRRPCNRKRGAYIESLARDERLFSRARHTQTTLIEMVMSDQDVKRNNAKRIISAARQLARAGTTNKASNE